MTYFKHICEQIELVLILSSVLLFVSALLLLSVKIIAFVL
jgi:hypothetical protein